MRARLRGIVARRPGTSIRELADFLGIQRTAVVHHLRLLARAGEVRNVRSGRRVLVFPATASPFEGLLSLLRVRAVQQLVAAVQAQPAASIRGLARELGVTPRAVRYHVLRLREMGLLDLRWGPGGRRVLVLDARACEAVEAREPPEASTPPLTTQSVQAMPLVLAR